MLGALLLSLLTLIQTGSFAVIVRGGRVLDGTGNPFIHADVGIQGDTVTAVGDLSGARARREIDATGQCVYQEGVSFVLVNGELVVDGGKPTEARPGRVLTRQRKRDFTPISSSAETRPVQ